MKKKGIYNIIYAVVMVFLVAILVILPDLDDTLTLILASLAIILTSIFTYSNRRKR
ncbi:hypothetical protein [Candidatus Izimaplasma sp. HR1]|uniref:hypothetical protein n=1 Tax=Candidatus Izimoplasma sp. HR1 TaxID=1541959 RepID=UPI00130DE7A9